MKKEQDHIDETILLKVIENTADEKERSLFTKWIETSAENAKFFEQLKKTGQLTTIDNDSLQKNWESVVSKVKAGKEVPDYIALPDIKTLSLNLNRNTFFRIAAMLVVLLGVSILLKTIVIDFQELIISGTDLTPSRPYYLADSSAVYLNGNSEISISKKFGEKQREIALKGEAFFEVKRNENIPFSITTNKTTIEVLGTSFNVYSDQSEEVRVTVISGEVEFFTDKKTDLLRLKAGEQGVYIPGLEGVKKGNIINPNFLAWKTGILYFNDTPVQEAFRLLQNQYSRVLIFKEKQNDLHTLTTTIENQPMDAVLEELNLLLNMKHEIRNDTIFFIPHSH